MLSEYPQKEPGYPAKRNPEDLVDTATVARFSHIAFPSALLLSPGAVGYHLVSTYLDATIDNGCLLYPSDAADE